MQKYSYNRDVQETQDSTLIFHTSTLDSVMFKLVIPNLTNKQVSKHKNISKQNAFSSLLDNYSIFLIVF